jgi:hypothetical protein
VQFVVVENVNASDDQTFSVSFSPPLQPNGRPSFASPYVQRRFSTVLPVSLDIVPTFSVSAMTSAGVVDERVISPFVCGQMPDLAQRLEEGWAVTETDNIMLSRAGKIALDGDFDFPLYHKCDLVAPGGADAEGSGTVASSPGACDEPSRQNTKLTITTGALARTLVAKTCVAGHFRTPGALLEVRIAGDDGAMGDAFEILLAHCLAPGEAYPLGIQAPVSTHCSWGDREDLAIFIGPEGGRTRVPATAGGWSLDAVDLAVAGVVRGHVDATFSAPGGMAFQVVGPFEMPNTKIPP